MHCARLTNNGDCRCDGDVQTRLILGSTESSPRVSGVHGTIQGWHRRCRNPSNRFARSESCTGQRGRYSNCPVQGFLSRRSGIQREAHQLASKSPETPCLCIHQVCWHRLHAGRHSLVRTNDASDSGTGGNTRGNHVLTVRPDSCLGIFTTRRFQRTKTPRPPKPSRSDGRP
jgi:hypothetical protein